MAETTPCNRISAGHGVHLILILCWIWQYLVCLCLLCTDLGVWCWCELQTSNWPGVEEPVLLGFRGGCACGADQPSGTGENIHTHTYNQTSSLTVTEPLYSDLYLRVLRCQLNVSFLFFCPKSGVSANCVSVPADYFHVRVCRRWQREPPHTRQQ